MSKLEDKLAASIKTPAVDPALAAKAEKKPRARKVVAAGTPAADVGSIDVAPSAMPETAAEAPRALHPRRVWPD